MLTLFHAPKSRSGAAVWLLEELGVPYQAKMVDIRRGDGSGARDPANPRFRLRTSPSAAPSTSS
jgi:glutathione S-transferase